MEKVKICYCNREMWHTHNDDLIYDYDYAGPKGPNAMVWIGYLYLTYAHERRQHTHEKAWNKALAAFADVVFSDCGSGLCYDIPAEWEVEMRYIKHNIVLSEADSY